MMRAEAVHTKVRREETGEGGKKDIVLVVGGHEEFRIHMEELLDGGDGASSWIYRR